MKIGKLTEVASSKYSEVFRALIAVGPSKLWLPVICGSEEEVTALQMSARAWFNEHKADEYSLETKRETLTHTLYMRLIDGV